jgi:hypothetical protein
MERENFLAMVAFITIGLLSEAIIIATVVVAVRLLWLDIEVAFILFSNPKV